MLSMRRIASLQQRRERKAKAKARVLEKAKARVMHKVGLLAMSTSRRRTRCAHGLGKAHATGVTSATSFMIKGTAW